MRKIGKKQVRQRVVVIACSTGGPKALVRLFSKLPKGFPATIVIAQHMPRDNSSALAHRLDRLGTVPCSPAKDGELLTPGRALIAPGCANISLKIPGRIELTESPHGEDLLSADLLFTSAAEAFGPLCMGIVLTGMGSDGAVGAANIRKAGGLVFGESEKSCIYYGMPRAALEAGGIDAFYPIDSMAAAIMDRVCPDHPYESRASVA